MRIGLKISKIAKPHKRPMSKRPDCYELSIILYDIHTLYVASDESPAQVQILCKIIPQNIRAREFT